MKILSVFLLFTYTTFSQTNTVFNFNTTEELRVRNGLPNFFSKLGNGSTLKIGFIGGSITAGEDDQWSGKVFNWLKSHYTNSNFVKHNVAVPGTSADFGAFRIGSKMLVHNPDLVFIEYRVNGLGRQGYKGPEGMVRQILKNNPNTDICFVYTIAQGMIESVRAGNQTNVGKVLEETANHYGVPSIDMGIEVVKLLDENKLIFKGNTAEDGKILFTKDGTHPLEAGAEIYKDVVVRGLLEMSTNKTPLTYSLPTALDKNSFVSGTIHTIDEVTKSDNWALMNPDTDTFYRSARWRSIFVLGDAYKTSQINETITFNWEGYALAMTTILQGDGISIEITTDGSSPKEYTFTQVGSRYPTELYYTPFLSNGMHTTTVKVTKLPNASSFYFGQFYTAKKLNGALSNDLFSVNKELYSYPNPVQDFVKINTSLREKDIIIYTTNGSVVKPTMVEGKGLDVRFLTQGVYILKIGNIISRFVKE